MRPDLPYPHLLHHSFNSMSPENRSSRFHEDASASPAATQDSRHASAGDLFFIFLLLTLVLAIVGMVCFGVYVKVMR